MPDVKIKITRQTVVDGKRVKVDDVVTTRLQTANYLYGLGKAVFVNEDDKPKKKGFQKG